MSVFNGLRVRNGPTPSYTGMRAEHNAYITALRDADVQVGILDPSEYFPDSIFIEDTALVFSQGAIVLRPGALRGPQKPRKRGKRLRDISRML
jgi:dimethylargininase